MSCVLDANNDRGSRPPALRGNVRRIQRRVRDDRADRKCVLFPGNRYSITKAAFWIAVRKPLAFRASCTGLSESDLWRRRPGKDERVGCGQQKIFNGTRGT